MKDLAPSATINLPLLSETKVNQAALKKVNQMLPEFAEKTRFFGSSNSQTTLSMMSLTMLNGQSPFRMLRQILAEAEKRKGALVEAQFNHAKQLQKIEALEQKPFLNSVEKSKLTMLRAFLDQMEDKINGSIVEIATLGDAYNNIKKRNNIDDWNEEAFEAEEKRHHVRRAFELIYRNIIERGSASEGSLEYCQQFGIHPQSALAEVRSYAQQIDKEILENRLPSSNCLEDFLDSMARKYEVCADQASERIFGKSDFANSDYMMRNVKG